MLAACRRLQAGSLQIDSSPCSECISPERLGTAAIQQIPVIQQTLVDRPLTARPCPPSLQGTIPPELTDLEHLSSLRLANCNLSGALPPELFLLRQLGVLDVSGNKGLRGNLPDTIG
jgi:hypothetical protein